MSEIPTPEDVYMNVASGKAVHKYNFLLRYVCLKVALSVMLLRLLFCCCSDRGAPGAAGCRRQCDGACIKQLRQQSNQLVPAVVSAVDGMVLRAVGQEGVGEILQQARTCHLRMAKQQHCSTVVIEC